MPAINPVTVMTRVLPRKWHVHLGIILSPRPRRALDRHTRLENHLADPDSSHSGLCTSLPRNQDKRDRGAAGPLGAAHENGCAEPRGACMPAPELCPGGTRTAPVRLAWFPIRETKHRKCPERGSALPAHPKTCSARVPKEMGFISLLFRHQGLLHSGVTARLPGGE